MKLTTLELLAYTGIQAKEREFIIRLQNEQALLCKEIEDRLALPAGSIGTTHELDLNTNEIRPKQK